MNLFNKIKNSTSTSRSCLLAFDSWIKGYVTGIDAQTGELLIAIDNNTRKPLRDLFGVKDVEYVNAIEFYLEILEG